mmetsp:Transcript_15206/g.33235  ORF Transcript_15206/g.33235 Transcript_15206/m.33235 type:complete len:266 (+) Transcript_15206:966-1763(+)
MPPLPPILTPLPPIPIPDCACCACAMARVRAGAGIGADAGAGMMIAGRRFIFPCPTGIGMGPRPPILLGTPLPPTDMGEERDQALPCPCPCPCCPCCPCCRCSAASAASLILRLCSVCVSVCVSCALCESCGWVSVGGVCVWVWVWEWYWGVWECSLLVTGPIWLTGAFRDTKESREVMCGGRIMPPTALTALRSVFPPAFTHASEVCSALQMAPAGAETSKRSDKGASRWGFGSFAPSMDWKKSLTRDRAARGGANCCICWWER